MASITLGNSTTLWSSMYHMPIFSPSPPVRSNWSPMGRVNPDFLHKCPMQLRQLLLIPLLLLAGVMVSCDYRLIQATITMSVSMCCDRITVTSAIFLVLSL
jgi:hypothetical protein